MASSPIVRSLPTPAGLNLNKRAVIIASGAVVVILALVLVSAFSETKKKKRDDGSMSRTNPSPLVESMPGSYEDIKRKEEPKNVVIVERPEKELPKATDSDLKKLLEALAKEKLQRRLEARASKVSFEGVEVGGKSSLGLSNLLAGSGGTGGASTGDAQASMNPRDDANRQDEKNAFLDKKRYGDTHLLDSLEPQASPYELMAGTIIPGVMLTGVNSDLPGQIMGQVSQNIFDSVEGEYLLLPQGTKVIGMYDSRVAYGQERVLIVWTRLILPNGESISLEGMPGVDMSGYAGLSDEVDNHYLKLLTGVVFSSLLSASAQMAEGPTYNTVNPEFGQLATQGFAKNVNEVGQEITRKNINIQPTLIINPGFRFNIFVTKDITLKPYEENIEE